MACIFSAGAYIKHTTEGVLQSFSKNWNAEKQGFLQVQQPDTLKATTASSHLTSNTGKGRAHNSAENP